MEAVKRKMIMERIGKRNIFFPEPPFVVPSQMPESYLIENVPYFPQEEMTWSGAAVFHALVVFYGQHIDQQTIVRVATPEPYPSLGTETWRENTRRVASVLGFGAMSYYPFRYLSIEQIVAHEQIVHDVSIKILKSIVADNQPVYVRLRQVRTDKVISFKVKKWLEMVGHAVLVVGYTEREVIIHDPWNAKVWGGQGGPYCNVSWNEFQEMWCNGCTDYMLLIQPPVAIEIDSIPAHIKQGEPFDLPVCFTYRAPTSFAPWAPVIEQPMAILDITTSDGLVMRVGQHPVKSLGNCLKPCQTASVRWGLHSDQNVKTLSAKITFEGIVHEPNAPFPYMSKVFHHVSRTF